MVVRFAEGEARRAVDTELRATLATLFHDPDLDVAACLTGLVGTGVDLLLRFRRWEAWPLLAFLLVGKFNPHHRQACYDFLRVPASELGVGFSLELQRLALSQGAEHLAMRWLLSDG